MDSLRLALLIIGVIIIALVYWQARRKPSADIQNSQIHSRIEPGFDDSDALIDEDLNRDELPSITIGDKPAAARGDPIRAQESEADIGEEHQADETELDTDEAPESEIPEKVISLRIVKKDGSDFSAEEVILNLRGVGLVHGRFGIFHRVLDDADGDAVFSVASLTEPGNFDLQNIRDKRLAGLSLFMLRPGPGRGVDAFDKMVETARAVATSLQGELLDGDGSTMSIQRERFMREELIQYELKHLKL